MDRACLLYRGGMRMPNLESRKVCSRHAMKETAVACILGLP